MRCASVAVYGKKTVITFYNSHRSSRSCLSSGKDLDDPVSSTDIEKNVIDSVHRSFRMVERLFLCNKWDFFVTLTLAPSVCKDRSNADVVKMVLRDRLNRLLKSGIDFDYLLVPDYHEDGNLHFHGFFRIDKKYLRRAGNFKLGGHYYPRYYMPWLNRVLGRNEFRILSRSGAFERQCLSYVLKYVTKTKELSGWSGARYFASRGLKRVTELTVLEGDDAEILEGCLPATALKAWDYDYGLRVVVSYDLCKVRSLWELFFATLELRYSLACRERLSPAQQLSFFNCSTP